MNMIRKFTLQSLFFLIVLGTLGTILRIKMAVPFLPELRSNFLLHAHSHIAVLGWTNVGFIALILFFTFSQKALERLTLKIFFGILLIVNLGIAPSFMAQGYGTVAIIFSTLSILLNVWFLIIYFRGQNQEIAHTPFHRFFTTGVIFYVLSAVGLMMVAVHMAAKFGGEEFFDAGVYFYLHSQYNGWMIFILIASVYAYLHKKGASFSAKSVKWQWALLTMSFLPTYIPQLTYDLPLWVILIGVVGAILSLIATVLFLQTTWKAMLSFIDNKWIRLLFSYTMLAFFAKSVLEVGGALPLLKDLVHTNRQVVIGYLHLTLLAFISTYLIFAFYQYLLQNRQSVKTVTLLFVSGTFLMVVTLFLDGLLQWLHIYSNAVIVNYWLAFISVMLTISGAILFVHALRPKTFH